MKTKSSILKLNIESFKNFIKMNNSQKKEELKTKGVLLDNDVEKENTVNLYFLNGFFVEEILTSKENELIDIIPFKHGYKIENFAEVKEVIVPKRSFLLG